MRRVKNRAVALALTAGICIPVTLAQPLAIMAETAQVSWETKEPDGRMVYHERDEKGVRVATPDNAEYTSEGEPTEDENVKDEALEDEAEEEDAWEIEGENGEPDAITPDEKQECSTPSNAVPEEELEAEPEKRPELATPSEAAKPEPATPSNAVPELLATPVTAGDIWGGYTMSSELSGEGTEEEPYLIKSENDLKYLAYHTAEGNVDGFSQCYFRLTRDITLSSGASWIPIGYFWSSTDPDPEPFRGTFDGGGYTIKNLAISRYDQVYAGLFGQTMGATIKDLKVSASISAGSYCGGIAGEANDTVIMGCQVSGTVKAAGTAGGIVGEGYAALVDDCRNTATVYAAQPSADAAADQAYAGGIIGSAHDSKIVNCSSETTESATSVYAEGYVGGIAGNLIASRIYNVYVSGKIGSISAEAIGGIVGRLESGEIKIARMEGSIGKNTSSGLKWAGLYVGYIVDSATQLGKDLSYLYTDSEEVYALNPFGNMLNGLIDKTHHIGAYSSSNTVSLYCPVTTPKFSLLADTYFYEELEDGVLEVADPDVFHWAPSRTGAPVRGYHVFIPAVDHGTISVIEAQNPFAKEINWANSGAVADGKKLLVYAAPINEIEGDEPVYYELVPDSLRWTEDGGDDYGLIRTDTAEVSFSMPQKDITISADYRAMTNGVVLDQAELHYTVEHIRSGSRWEPKIAWRITDPQKLYATVLPSSAANKEVVWNVKDTDGSSTDVITIDQEGTVSVNQDAKWINDLISSAVQNQLNLYPSKPITLEATAYASATVTARANGSRASSLVTVDFKVTDHTVVPVQEVTLNEASINFEVERRLTGDRRYPEETVRVTPGKRLYAAINPIYSTNKEVRWSNGDGLNDQDMITVNPEGLVTVNPQARWIADLIAVEDGQRVTNPYAPFTAQGNRATYVTVTTADGGKNAVCAVNVTFKTVDETVVHPEAVTIEPQSLVFTVEAEKTGPRNAVKVAYHVTEPQSFRAMVVPSVAENQNVTWKSSDQGAVAVDQMGMVTVYAEKAAWISDLVASNTAAGQRDVPVTVTTEDGGYTAIAMVHINFKMTDNTYPANSGGSSGGGGGGGSSSGGTFGGQAGVSGGPGGTAADTPGNWKYDEAVQKWQFFRPDGTAIINQWEQITYNGATEWYYFGADANMVTGWYTDLAGNTFYLYPVADGMRGKMLTGWNMIDGKWYYFNNVSDGTRGAMLRDTRTPDNYYVNRDGIWIP